MFSWCKYHKSVTNLFSLAFQQLKSIYRVWKMLSTGNFLKSKVFTTQCLLFLDNVYHFLQYIE
jgi:hypothetical protein